ncbi:MAG: Lrp/AsnC family transcriptional regulator [Oscillospiraceae bacterium]|nr:Lrp/AsnC family transcriptional regulator [Oscillospiraceae bacterium]
MVEVLKLLEEDGQLTPAQIASMLNMEQSEVEKIIEKCVSENIIIGSTTLIDWDKTSDETVTAMIEVKISPQRGDGYDRIAERIFQYEEVESLYLMSGGYDLAVTISGRSMKEIAQFVFARLAPLEGVTSTATHFILKKYKEKHKVFYTEPEQEERLLFV